MQLHTKLTVGELQEAVKACQKAGTIAANTRIEVSEHKSRSADRRLDIKLVSIDAPTPWAKRTVSNRYGRDYGQRGEYSGTWQEHGYLFAVLFEIDPKLDIYRVYPSKYEFSEDTLGIFDGGQPLEHAVAEDLKAGDYITGWGRTSSGLGIVAGVERLNKRTVEVSIKLYGGIYGYRYTDKQIMRAERPVLVAR